MSGRRNRLVLVPPERAVGDFVFVVTGLRGDTLHADDGAVNLGRHRHAIG